MEHLPLLQHQVNTSAGSAQGQFGNFVGAVNTLLGPGTTVQRTNGDMRYSRSHSTTGIPYAISGTATVIESVVSAKLAMFTDPIKAILGTAVHDTQRIIIKRKYVAGGGAHIVPEHASARTIAIREDIREVMLSRYGNDIEMNLNLFLRPKDAEQELKMKLEASQLALEKRLVRIGYEAVLSEGVDLAVAIARSRNQDTLADLSVIYNRQLFGIMAKSAYPITTIMAAAKLANAYALSVADKTVMILPFGTPEIIKYTKPHQMEYMLSGVPLPKQAKIDLKIPGGFKDEFSNCTIYQHIPPTDISAGVPNLRVEPSLLTRYVTVFSVVRATDPKSTCVLNYKTGGLFNLPIFESEVKLKSGTTFSNAAEVAAHMQTLPITPLPADSTEATALAKVLMNGMYIRRTRLKMRSGILAAPGSETGELLYAYSSCSVTTNPSTELGKLGLRVYLGAIIKEPNNIFILPNIAFESVVSDILIPITKLPEASYRHHKEKNDSSPHIWDTFTRETQTLSTVINDATACNHRITIFNSSGADKDTDFDTGANFMMPPVKDRSEDHHVSMDECAVFDNESKRTRINSGSLGDLDHPDRVGRLSGLVEFTEYGPTSRQ